MRSIPAACSRITLGTGEEAMRPLTILRTLLVWLLGVLGNVLALADAGDRTIFQWQHTAWGAKEGAPAGIIALAQTMDGYLWLATEGGLFRFDGVSFERYEPQFQAGAGFPARTVRSLLPLPNGDLWIGFEFGGISLVRNGRITNYGTRERVPGGRVWRLEQGRRGTSLAAT